MRFGFGVRFGLGDGGDNSIDEVWVWGWICVCRSMAHHTAHMYISHMEYPQLVCEISSRESESGIV